MVYVPGGEFIFGRDGGPEDESPQQVVEVAGFNIDKYPVTNAEYAKFVEATGHRVPRHWTDGKIPDGKDDHPVVWVSWEDADAYAKWAGKRLPTEFEWEKAARGTEGLAYPWGDTFDATKCNSSESGLGDTSPVGAYPDGASPSGAEDMCGNVMEWTADWYQAYRGSLYANERYGQTHKVMRGGSWFDNADAVRTTTRKSGKPSFRFSTIGFRCAK
jgi:formylglycine-generating enzyme required for sulfatase activity